MTKTYLVSEEVLRQVLLVVQSSRHVSARDVSEILRTILAEEPEIEEGADPNAGRTPAELRKAGFAYCPRCFTFGHSHRKNCQFSATGMTHHVKDA